MFKEYCVKHRLCRLVLNLMFVTSLLALMPATNSAAASDRIPPCVLYTSPASGAYNIPIGNNILVSFSEKVLPGPTASYNSISLTDAGGNPVAFVKSISGGTLIIDPISYLSTGAYYKITIPAGALKDESGNRLRANYSFSFTTSAPVIDTTPVTNNTNTTGTPIPVTDTVTTTDTTTPVTSNTTTTDTPTSVTSITTTKDTTTPVTVSCDALGMIPDDSTKGLYNYNILIAEAKKGTRININGTYYLQSSYSENEVDKGLFLTGDSPANSKLILMGGSFFNIKGSALIENISIECPTNRASFLIRMTAPFVNEITIRNNYITGNIRLVNSIVPLDFDFASTACCIKRLVIDSNEFYDVYNNSGAPYIINLTDTPINLSHIKNNKVTNFSYIFYQNGITNDHPFKEYLIKNNNAVIENNTVICTDDYDAVAKNSGATPLYYCFALIEGLRVECIGNTFEGFHVSDAPNIGVYDNYFSVTKLLYEDNTYKNIVNFTPAFDKTYLMMSKVGIGVDGEKTERIYRNNTYIVEPGYADRFGKDRFLLRKDLNIYQVDIDYITIEDNYFDMYILRFNHTNQKYKELYKFNRNTVLMHTIDLSKYVQTFAYIKEMIDESGDFIPRNLIFTNNNITCKNEPLGQAIGTKEFSLIYNDAGSGDKTTVDFSNNYIDVPGLVYVHSYKRPYSVIAALINPNNIIKNTAMQSESTPSF